MKKLILLELNEINFDIIFNYIKSGYKLPNFQYLFDNGLINTISEDEYDLLEPWIQWPSVHTGKNYKSHNIFRLGDFVNSSHDQIFEKIEKAGYSVGAISPMNASNNLKNPKYFIPDPWTKTKPDKSFFSRSIHDAISQAVNDNSQSKLTFKTIVSLFVSILFLVSPIKYPSLFSYALSSFKKPWKKALFLDILLHEIHKTLYRRKKTDFSTLFLNAGAHIQHHYFFNSPHITKSNLKNPSWYIKENEDPFHDMLLIYDKIIGDLLKIKGTELLLSTGLSQKPYNHLKFYYRLKNHKKFFDDLNFTYKDIIPRMTRDFLITFDSIDDAIFCENKLKKILVDGKKPLFEEIDNRGNEIFVVLTYPHEIKKNTYISYLDLIINLFDYVTFVAIKNGEHQSNGFAYFSNGLKKYAPNEGSHISDLHFSILRYFDV